MKYVAILTKISLHDYRLVGFFKKEHAKKWQTLLNDRHKKLGREYIIQKIDDEESLESVRSGQPRNMLLDIDTNPLTMSLVDANRSIKNMGEIDRDHNLAFYRHDPKDYDHIPNGLHILLLASLD